MTYLKNIKLKSKMIILSAIIGATVLIMGLVVILVLEQQKSNIEQEMSRSMLRNKEIIAFTHLAKDISLNVVQVQQWLTDISATRAQDGLNDGFEQAENNAQEFKTDLAAALKISQKLYLTEATSVLTNISLAFSPYYSSGKKMAQSYIEFGPAEGNKMMSQFDEAAEKINNAVSQLIVLSEKELKKLDAQMQDDTESFLASLTLVEILNFSGVFFVLLISTSAVILIQSIVGRPLSELNGIMQRLADGEYEIDLPELDRRDEIGEMAETLAIFQKNAQENKRLEEQSRIANEEQQKTEREIKLKEEQYKQEELDRERAELAEKEARTNRINNLISTFEQKITKLIQIMATSSTEMSTASEQMVSTSSDTKQRSAVVAKATDDTVSNINMVAAAAEELSNSVQEISRQVTKSKDISQKSLEEAEQSEASISALAEAARKINDVIEIISDIAAQTNLLALNATIESARAGDAGKGFAVVASEVKALAGQTSNATSEISSQIREIQDLTLAAVNSIKNIVVVSNESNESATSIQAAVEQQNAATNEISQNIQLVAEAANEVSSNISSVAQGAEETGSAGEQVLTIANELGNISGNLKQDIEQFLEDVRNS